MRDKRKKPARKVAERHDAQVKVYLRTEQEKALLEKAAAAADLKLSTWLRNLALAEIRRQLLAQEHTKHTLPA